MMGEKVGAMIVPLPGESVDPREVVDYACEGLADFKVPQYIDAHRAPSGSEPGEPHCAQDHCGVRIGLTGSRC